MSGSINNKVCKVICIILLTYDLMSIIGNTIIRKIEKNSYERDIDIMIENKICKNIMIIK